MNERSFFSGGMSLSMKTSDKRSDIIQASMELISEQGFHGTPMSGIAAKAGVATGTIYRYFDSRNELITELYRELEKRIISVIQDGYPVGRPIRERFLHLVSNLFRHFIACPLHFRYLEQYHNSPYGTSLRQEILLNRAKEPNILSNLFLEGIERKVLKDFPLPVLFALTMGPLRDLIRDHILGFISLNEETIRQVIEACWESIRTRDPSGTPETGK